MRLVVRPEAQNELLTAQAWYELQAPGLGLEFARAVDVAVQRLLRMPLAFARIEANFRYVVLRKFPYSIIYYASEQEIVLVSFFHHKREPGAWKSNV